MHSTIALLEGVGGDSGFLLTEPHQADARSANGVITHLGNTGQRYFSPPTLGRRLLAALNVS